MNYERIILELMERIQILESKVTVLEEKLRNASPEASVPRISENTPKSISSKYRGLTEYLLKSNSDRIQLTYSEIEKLIGFPLPSSARNHMRAYWANTETHSYASSWLAIGYKARVDVEHSTVIFEKELIV